ncbi:MAG: NmrA family NAD(P)-binding protein [Polyangiales bacterium]
MPPVHGRAGRARPPREEGPGPRDQSQPPRRPRAALAAQGVEVVAADMDDPASLQRALAGARRVFSVQSWQHVGIDGEARQGRAVAEACAEVGVAHLVYGSAGTGEAGTGVAHFEVKLGVEAHTRALGVPLTVLRPCPFMELMVADEFYPQVGVWNGERKIVGLTRRIPWVAAHDIGEAIANAFAAPERWIGREAVLVSDVRSLGEARELYTDGLGRAPRAWPLPLWLVQRMAGKDLLDMWHWMVAWLDGAGGAGLDTLRARSREIIPTPTDMPAFFRAWRAAAVPS